MILYPAESDSVAIVKSWHSLPDSGSLVAHSFFRDRLETTIKSNLLLVTEVAAAVTMTPRP